MNILRYSILADNNCFTNINVHIKDVSFNNHNNDKIHKFNKTNKFSPDFLACIYININLKRRGVFIWEK